MNRELRKWLAPFRTQFAALAEWSGIVFRRLIPRPGDLGSLRICSACGRITSKYKKLCLECGEPLKVN
jgi:predicted amidophosphoribosyltransferase